ncbi:MarR family winged helix-turn-helix transcriptional regulator [soil metagenome]
MNPDTNKLPNAAYNSGILQGKAYRTLQNHLTGVLKPYGVSIPEWKILGKLYDNQKLKVVELANALDVDPPLITKLINRLESVNFVEREREPEDQRIVWVKQTEKGKKLIPELEIAVRKELGYLLDGVTRDDMAAYKKVLQTIVTQGKLAVIKKSYLLE